jgi:hypothetical protein
MPAHNERIRYGVIRSEEPEIEFREGTRYEVSEMIRSVVGPHEVVCDERERWAIFVSSTGAVSVNPLNRIASVIAMVGIFGPTVVVGYDSSDEFINARSLTPKDVKILSDVARGSRFYDLRVEPDGTLSILSGGVPLPKRKRRDR